MTSPGHRWLSAPMSALLLAAVYGAGVSSVLLRPDHNPVSGWWPAAGIAVVMVALSRPGVGVLASVAASLVVVTGLANLTGGRPWDVSLCYGLANAAEAVAAGLVLRARPSAGPPRLSTLPDFVRLVVAAVVGGVVIAVGVALTALGLDLGSAWDSARATFASHAAATLVIVPIALTRRSSRTPGSPGELLAQSVTGVLVTVVVFRPDQELALTFLPPLFLVWAALRFDARTVATQLVVFAASTTTFTALGWGPFGAEASGALTTHGTAAALGQGYLVCSALLSLPLALLLEQRNDLLDRVSAEEVLFRRNFTDSLLGQLLLRDGDHGLVVDDANDTALAVLGQSREAARGASLDVLLDLTESDLALRLAGGQPWRGQLSVRGREARVEVGVSRLSQPGEPEQVWAAQLLDVSAEYVARTRLEAAEKLTSATLDTTAAIILLTDLDGRIVRVNAATTDMTGYTEADLVGHKVWETTLAPSTTPDLEALFVWPNRSGAPVVREHEAITKQGKRRRIMWSNNIVRDEKGLPAYAVLTGIDVTTERASAGLVTHLMQAAITTAIIGVGTDGRITVINSGAERMLDLEGQRVVGEPFLQLLDPDQLRERLGVEDPEEAFRLLVAGVGEGEMPARDWVWVARDGTRRIVSMTLSVTEATLTSEVGFLCVGRDVTEQRQGQDMLVAALEKERTAVERLRAIDEAKNEFVSTVSHELRTPVTSIVGYTEMLQDGTIVDPLDDQLPLFETIARNGQRLIVLCNDLLLLSGLDSGNIQWKAEEVDLGALLRTVEDATAPLVSGRDLSMIYEQPEHPAVVTGDRSQIERVLLNLVSNAVKFTEDGGVVRTRVEVDADEAVITVTDTGIGIPIEEQENLFQKFFRTSNAQKEAIQGTGLGLSIVSAIVSAHGGTIRVRSAYLEGSTFTVRLPLKF